ncbi:MAG: hypothetical protein CMB59_00545 [Euryarchaeota archaeon]|nr:hypothetical protein [Euryarchaeota archaeon]|tara:strand:- start:2083 stop:3510 length:1428 start_codon:yes stop_codon:yes gene_type:complete
MRGLAVFLAVLIVAPTLATAEPNWPGEPVDNHIYMSWAALTQEVNDWSIDNPDIVQLSSIGQSYLGKELWMVVLSDWAMETKSDGTAKEIIYIDGGHHGNEYLGTALAWLTAKWYINGWNAQNEEAMNVLQSTELHIMIMLNPDGNDADTRHNLNLTTAANPFVSEPVPTGIDLNRNYDHFWDDCSPSDPFAPGGSAFSEPETRANANYMNNVVQDADLYVTMHTGVWIMLYPWGKWPEQPPDWELFHGIREDVHAGISDIPIQNANQGLYPNCGTSRDYGYGVMGFPTFTFETDDDQFLPGTFEDVNERLDEELDVMRYLINNIWYWRARLVVESFSIDDEVVTFTVNNMGRASTQNATLQYIDGDKVLWESDNFTANATSKTTVKTGGFDYEGGEWRLSYQKRVVHSSQWVNESVSISPSTTSFFSQSVETLVWVLQAGAVPLFVVAFAFWWSREEKPFDLEDESPLEAELLE